MILVQMTWLDLFALSQTCSSMRRHLLQYWNRRFWPWTFIRSRGRVPGALKSAMEHGTTYQLVQDGAMTVFRHPVRLSLILGTYKDAWANRGSQGLRVQSESLDLEALRGVIEDMWSERLLREAELGAYYDDEDSEDDGSAPRICTPRPRLSEISTCMTEYNATGLIQDLRIRNTDENLDLRWFVRAVLTDPAPQLQSFAFLDWRETYTELSTYWIADLFAGQAPGLTTVSLTVGPAQDRLTTRPAAFANVAYLSLECLELSIFTLSDVLASCPLLRTLFLKAYHFTDEADVSLGSLAPLPLLERILVSCLSETDAGNPSPVIHYLSGNQDALATSDSIMLTLPLAFSHQIRDLHLSAPLPAVFSPEIEEVEKMDIGVVDDRGVSFALIGDAALDTPLHTASFLHVATLLVDEVWLHAHPVSMECPQLRQLTIGLCFDKRHETFLGLVSFPRPTGLRFTCRALETLRFVGSLTCRNQRPWTDQRTTSCQSLVAFIEEYIIPGRPSERLAKIRLCDIDLHDLGLSATIRLLALADDVCIDTFPPESLSRFSRMHAESRYRCAADPFIVDEHTWDISPDRYHWQAI